MSKLQWSHNIKFTKFVAKTSQKSKFADSLELVYVYFNGSIDTGSFEYKSRLMFLVVEGLWTSHLI